MKTGRDKKALIEEDFNVKTAKRDKKTQKVNKNKIQREHSKTKR